MSGARETAWTAGRFDERPGPPELLFGRMVEDWRVEAAVFPPRGRVFCIASAGCTALALARRGLEVTAVDLNPVQADYVRARAAGAPARAGRAEHLLALGRRLLPGAGLRRRRLEEFLDLEAPAEQAAWWARHGARPLGRLLRLVDFVPMLAPAYGPSFRGAVPRRFGAALGRRLARGFAAHPNRDNPFARRLLLGSDAADPETAGALPRGARLEVACADAADYLERCAPAAFDAFSLSNVLDGASPAYAARLWRAVAHAAVPGAPVMLRSLAEPRTPAEDAAAAADRALIWGAIGGGP